MRHVKTEAIVLYASDIFDADRSLLLFSEQLGKVRARARGVRRPSSRLTGHLLPYLATQLELIEGNSGWLVTQAHLVDSLGGGAYPGETLSYMRQAELVSETLNRLYVDEEAHPDVYFGLAYTLERLRDLLQAPGSALTAQLVAAEFLFKALAELGYRPELQRSLVGSESLDPKRLAWSDALGGLVDAQAARSERIGAYPIGSSKTVVLLRELLRPEFQAERLRAPDEIAEEACRVIYGYVQYQIGQPLKSLL